MNRVAIDRTFESWRDAARGLLQAGVTPDNVVWDDGESGPLLPNLLPLFEAPAPVRLTLPRRFVEIAKRVAAHREPSRWDLLYRIAYRLRENKHLMDVLVDDDVHRLGELDQAVRRDLHKMHAFVRFREVDGHFVAWYRPDHRIVPLAAPFFQERFRTMRWSILTPDASMHWDGEHLTFGHGVPRAEAPEADGLESLWRSYYASTFNPARVNLAKMRADMPTRFWRDMPELREVPRLLTDASSRVTSMIDAQRRAPTARPFVPDSSDLEALRDAAASCEGCPLFEPATQTVFGEGPAKPRLVLVGEQPGDHEDLQGRPFIGPAGEVLDRAMAAAGLDRNEVYLTNTVKHFAYVERGKARIHRQPRTTEVTACRPWLDAELRATRPEAVVALGSTAARALLGAGVRVLRDRGQWFTSRDGLRVLVTIHPSAVLRADASLRDEYEAALTADLRLARAAGVAPSSGALLA